METRTEAEIEQETIRKANEATRILESDVYKEAVKEAEQAIIQQWRAAETPTKRESAHGKLLALDEIETQLRVLMDRGTTLRHSAERTR
jgi:hypothetical protein